MTKTIGILTSGGDCAGLNATIRAVALRAHHGYGWKTRACGTITSRPGIAIARCA